MPEQRMRLMLRRRERDVSAYYCPAVTPGFAYACTWNLQYSPDDQDEDEDPDGSCLGVEVSFDGGHTWDVSWLDRCGQVHDPVGCIARHGIRPMVRCNGCKADLAEHFDYRWEPDPHA